ncbi:helix-turn-helix transcriptional regulator [Aestuariivirga sp.]|uniref:helix-turn-helix transcriptional regulator n=1 Tax=Aestuariivirga sp. TaxID=2650926 RepID=UPI00391D3863
MPTRPSNKLLLLGHWSRGIAEIAAAQRTPRFIPALLASVKRLVDFDFMMVFAYSGTARPMILGDTLDAPRHRIIAEDYAGGPFLLDPFFRLVEEGRRSGCYRLHDVAPDHFRRSEYFRVHYSRTGIGEEIGIFFDMGQGLTGVTSFGRWDDSPRLTRADLDILRALEPAVAALCAGHWMSLHGGRLRSPLPERGTHPRFGALTLREREIVTMILRGHSTESIAMQLGISPGTVKIHRKNIYRKMKVSTQAELFAAFLGLAAPSQAGPAYSPGDMEEAPGIPQFRNSSR